MTVESIIAQIIVSMPIAFGALAIVLLLPFLDRLRVMNFHTHRSSVVALHLFWAIWLAWIAYRGLMLTDFDWYQVFAMAAAWAWLVTSNPTWKHGPPEHASAPVPFDDRPADKFARTRPQ
jgi:hypothetical protein